MSTYWLKLHDMRFPLRLGETLLGRSPYCSIVLNDGLVSRQHAAVRVGREGVRIEDLGSRNGTWVNAQKISGPYLLAPGDRVEIGGQQILVELEAREERPQRDHLAVTGEYAALQDAQEDTLEAPTEPGRIPSYQETLRR
jgi:pSer/pThr/pTyr-binding forkhead associated (FHA) protein